MSTDSLAKPSGFGWYGSPWAWLGLFISGAFLIFLFDDLSYDFIRAEPRVIKDKHSALQVRHNDYVRVKLPLDTERLRIFESNTDPDIVIAPVEGSENHLFVYRHAPDDIRELLKPAAGRAVGADFRERWNVDGRALDLPTLMNPEGEQSGLNVPGNALLIQHGYRPQLRVWPLTLFAICAAFWGVFLFRLLFLTAPWVGTRR